jgi:hypothetical protein
VIRRLILGALAALCLWPAAASAQVINSTPPSCAKAGANTVTASAPVLDCTQTWNAGGVTFTGLKFNATDTASASGSLLLDLRVNNSQMLGVDKLGNGSAQVWAAFGGGVRAQSNTGTFALGTSLDVILARDAANILALRNGTSAQTFRIYNTYTDASNGEWGGFNWTDVANVLSIGTKANGTGSTRNLQFIVGGTNKLDYGVTTAGTWSFQVPVARKGYTVATLPASPGTGAMAYVTDAVACTFLAGITGGAATFCPVIYNGTAWVAE